MFNEMKKLKEREVLEWKIRGIKRNNFRISQKTVEIKNIFINETHEYY